MFLQPADASPDTDPDVRLNVSEFEHLRPTPKQKAEHGPEEEETETQRNQEPTETPEQKTERGAEEGETKTPTAMTTPGK
ncbi:hypothetical protein NDU88_008548 [Pleurodeles waltl]|uniref:Uncharacterized protein n=1 Tax=Pleurodeles waltl TaxID=8319 RepID=A0AAV7PSD0_PLEWA|nr:hypothetical protein NDU88_008548 [Pleurodeles waltl]